MIIKHRTGLKMVRILVCFIILTFSGSSISSLMAQMPPKTAKKPEIIQQEPVQTPKNKPAQREPNPKQLEPKPQQKVATPPPPLRRQRSTQLQINSKAESKTEKSSAKNLTVFPDEYAELDDVSNVNIMENEVILKTLEHARQKYLQALILVEKGDTVNAAKYFEKAIEVLNRVASYPGIELNNNFSDLAQSIIEDYENFVQSIENLSDDSPFFVVRDKLFQEVDDFKPMKMPEIKTISMPKDTSSSLVGNKPIILEPKEIVIPLDENEEVQKNMAFLTAEGKKGGRRFFGKWLERSTKWFPMMRRIAAEEEVPEELIYLSMIESGLRPSAVSSAKAVGLWQFIRSTGELYQLNDIPSVWIDERRDPEKATRAAMRHLRDLYNTFGNWHLALAAYNCGAGRVGRTVRRYGTDSSDFWDIREKLPKETQHYVPIYIAATKIALNPEAYGFNLDSLNFEDEYDYETYDLNEPVSLSVIAKCVDTTREAIQDLNPELIRSITPPDAEVYTIKLPKNKTQLFVANYSTLTPEEKEPWIMHTVLRGESISSIAREYGVSRSEIANANNLASYRSRLKRGAEIKIPVDKDYFLEKKREEEEKSIAITETQKLLKNNKGTTHIVRSGETLYSIANKYNIRMADLRNINNLPYDDDNIKIGQRLIVSADEKSDNKKETIASKSSDTKFIRHKVKSGETLHAISENYNVSINDIKKLNNLKNDKIVIGQMLVVETSSATGNYAVKTSPAETTVHEVKKGETLGTIAAHYGVSEDDLIKWNPKNISGTTVYLGTKLKIEEPNISKGSAQAPADNINKAPKYYTVQKGDNLSAIARKFGVSLELLKSKNKNLNPDNLLVGQKLRIQ